MKNYLQTLKSITLALVLMACVSVVSAVWAPNPGNPTSNNTSAPLMTGSTPESRLGSLLIGGTTAPLATVDVNGVLSTTNVTSFANSSVTGKFTTNGLAIDSLNLNGKTWGAPICSSTTGAVTTCPCLDTTADNYLGVGACHYTTVITSNINDSWTVPEGGHNIRVTAEVWGGGGSGWLPLSGVSMAAAGDTVFKNGQGGTLLVGHGGEDGSSAGGGNGGEGEIISLPSNTISSEVHTGGNGGGVPTTVAQPLFGQDTTCSAGNYLLFHNNGGDGALAGMPYGATTTVHSGGPTPQNPNAPLNPWVQYYNYFSQFQGYNFTCAHTPYASDDRIPGNRGDGLAGGGGGSTWGGRSGNWGSASQASANVPVTSIANLSECYDQSSCKGGLGFQGAYGGGAGGYAKAIFDASVGDQFSWTIGRGGERATSQQSGLGCGTPWGSGVNSACPDPGKGGVGQVKITYVMYK